MSTHASSPDTGVSPARIKRRAERAENDDDQLTLLQSADAAKNGGDGDGRGR